MRSRRSSDLTGHRYRNSLFAPTHLQLLWLFLAFPQPRVPRPVCMESPGVAPGNISAPASRFVRTGLVRHTLSTPVSPVSPAPQDQTIASQFTRHFTQSPKQLNSKPPHNTKGLKQTHAGIAPWTQEGILLCLSVCPRDSGWDSPLSVCPAGGKAHIMF